MKKFVFALVFVLSTFAAHADEEQPNLGELTFHSSDLAVKANGKEYKCHRSEMGHLSDSQVFTTTLVEFSCDDVQHSRAVYCSTYWKPEVEAVPSKLGAAEFTGQTRILTLDETKKPASEDDEEGGINATGSEVSYANVEYAKLNETATKFFAEKCLPQIKAK